MSDETQTIYVIRWSMKSGIIIKCQALPMPLDPTCMVVATGRLRGQQIYHWDWSKTDEEARHKIKREVAQRIQQNEADTARLRLLDFDTQAAIVDGETSDIRVVPA